MADPGHGLGRDAEGRTKASLSRCGPGTSSIGEQEIGKLHVTTLVTLDGVIQDPGGFQELEEGGWGNRYFDEEAQSYALEHRAKAAARPRHPRPTATPA
jgi:hypothetical protein